MPMTLDPDFAPILAALARRPQVPVSELDPLQFRATVEAARWPTRRQPLPRIENLDVEGGAGGIRARLYAPSSAVDLPLVVFFHGGGFVICSLDTHDNYCRALAHACGCAVLSVGYRRAPEHRFPAAAEDAIAALRWARDHARQLGCDPGRLAVAGDSAGGNLAAVAALHADVPLRHLLLLYPVIDPEEQGESWRTQSESPFLSAAMMRWFWDQYLQDRGQSGDARAAPLRHEGLHRLPETTVITAEVDPLCSEGEAFATALQRAGVAVDRRRYAGMPHGFATLVGMIGKADTALEHAAARLRVALSTEVDS
jgi:acetyl esterase